MAVAAGAIGVGVAPAQATPGQFSPAFPTVYISQVSGSTTDLKQAVQSRLANAGAGGVTISTVGTSVASYNAMGYRTADQYLYGMVGNHLNRVSSNGSSTDTGAVTGLPAGSYYSGAFGAGAYADTLFVMPLSGSTIYGIDAATSAVTTTLNLSASIGVADFTWANGYLWGISTSTGAPKLTRISMTGAVTNISTTGIFPVGDTGYYGAAWVYGNGNLAFSYNSTGRITQLKVTDPSGIAPTAALVSHIAGPSTSANDGATTPATDSDLGLALTQPAAADPGDLVTWQVTVSDAGPGGSSGGTLTFTVPAGVTVTSADLPTGCTLAGAVVQCISGQIAAAANDTYDFSGILNAGLTVPQTSTVAIVGNENDPDATDNTADLTFAPAPQNHTSNGTGIATQTTTVAKPSDASVYLLDGSTQVSTVAVPNQGTYTVDPETGVITFAPVTGFTGTASPVDFVIVPVTGATAAGSYQAAVAPPAGPTAVPVSTTGVGIDQQATAALAPAGGQLTLVDADGNDVMYLFTDDGGYSVEGDHLVFDEHRGWSGTAPSVAYKITDAYGQTSTSTYTVTVTKPTPPVAANETSTKAAGLTHTVYVDGERGTLLDGTSSDVGELVVAGKGSYRLDDGDGVTLQFIPVACFVGAVPPVGFQLIDAWGQRSNTATYTATVTAGSAPVVTNLTSTGVGAVPQSVTITAACGGTAHLVDVTDQPVTTLARAGEGTYTINPATGVLTFTPVFGYSGTPAPVTYRVTDSNSQSSDAAYTPTVTAPALPAPPAKTSTGVGTTVQSVQLTAPTSGSVALLDGAGNPTNALTAPGVGTYVLDPDTLVVSFAPAPGYHGTAAPITYQIVDAYGSTATATYTATVTAPAPPAAPAKTSTGPSGQVQQQQITVPTGGTVTLLDAHGHPTTTVAVPGQGTYTLNPVTGVITFTPLASFSGKAEPVTYQLTDAYGQSVTSAYTATVTKAKPTTPVGAPRLTAPALVKSAGAVPVACSLTKGRTTACTVTAHTSVNGKRTQVGTGTTTLTGAAGKNGAFTVKVKITLTGLGRALAARPGGVRLVLTAAVRQAHVAGTRYTTGTTLVQAPTVRLRPVYFGTDSATARAVDRAYLLKVRALLANVTSVTCTGYTDARSTVRYNATLAKRRAQTACAILIGTKHIKVTTISRGEKRPDHTNNTKNGRALNRRAELILKY